MLLFCAIFLLILVVLVVYGQICSAFGVGLVWFSVSILGDCGSLVLASVVGLWDLSQLSPVCYPRKGLLWKIFQEPLENMFIF